MPKPACDGAPFGLGVAGGVQRWRPAVAVGIYSSAWMGFRNLFVISILLVALFVSRMEQLSYVFLYGVFVCVRFLSLNTGMRDKKKVVRFLGCRSHTMIGTSQIAIIHSSIRIMALSLFDAAWLAQADMPILFNSGQIR